MFKIFFILFMITISCDSVSKEAVINYDLKTPTQFWKLPKELDEISGITGFNNDVVFCINDEKGIVYEYNLATKSIQNQFTFGKKQDYEDLAMVGETFYVLQSNGTLFWVAQDKKTIKNTTFLTQKQDTEGLCYDQKNHQLLIACKIKVEGKITVYGFDLKTYQLQQQSIVSFFNKKLTYKNFAPSGIAIHPKTGTIYMISSVSKSMVEINEVGKILNEYSLNYPHFIQPEGILFTQNGDLYISNEGRNKKGNILKFNYLP